MSERPAALPSRFSFASLHTLRLSRASLASWCRRLTYFWFVWTALLFVHEGGHALSAWRQGLTVHALTVGMGPVITRARYGETDIVLRLVPIAGITHIGAPRAETARGSIRIDAAASAAAGPHASSTRLDPHGWQMWRAGLITLVGGMAATLAFGLAMAATVFGRERATGRKWLFGRFVVADAIVLTVFNFFPVPPLDGGRAVLGTIAAWHGAPLAGDALFWVQAGGMALAVVPMTLWTRWTACIDSAASHWGTPRSR
jgi:Zn-dependent protease